MIIKFKDRSIDSLNSRTDALFHSKEEAEKKIEYYKQKYTLKSDSLPTENGYYSVLINIGYGLAEWSYDIYYDVEDKEFFTDEDGLIEDWTEYITGWCEK